MNAAESRGPSGSTHPAELTKRATKAAETRRRLLVAAAQLFAAAHYDDVSATEIARAAGVAHGVVFHHFGSKRGIYLETMRVSATELDSAFVTDPTLAPGDRLRRALTAHLHYVAEHRGLALRLILGGRGADPPAWEVFEATRVRALEGAAMILGLDASNHALRMNSRAAVGAIDEMTIYWLAHGEPFELEAVVECILRVIVATLEAAQTLDPRLDVTGAVRALISEP